jgi:flagellar protein FlgJ
VTTDAIFGPGFAALPERERLARAARELEAVVVAQLLASMRRTVPEGGLFERSPAEDVFQSMLDGEMARKVADRSPFGLADAVARQLSREDGARPARGWKA